MDAAPVPVDTVLLLRAISEVFTAIILVTIVLAAGLMVFFLLNSTVIGVGNFSNIEFDEATIVVTGYECTFIGTLKNAGTKPVVAIEICLPKGNNFYVDGVDSENPLGPGQSVAVTFGPSVFLGRYTPGESYVVTVIAETSDGSTFTKTFSARCINGGQPSSSKAEGILERAEVYRNDEYLVIYFVFRNTGEEPINIVAVATVDGEVIAYTDAYNLHKGHPFYCTMMAPLPEQETFVVKLEIFRDRAVGTPICERTWVVEKETLPPAP